MKHFVYSVLLSTAFIGVFILFLVGGSQLVLFFTEPLPKLYYGIFGTLGALLTLTTFSKLTHTSFNSIGLTFEKYSVFNWLKGILIGIGVFVPMILVLVLFGGMHFEKVNNNYASIGLSLLPFIPLALMEELAFRTYPFLILKSKLGTWNAQFIIALLFALYHILMGWPISIAFLGPFIWSFAFGWSALWSKGMAMPFGFHLALNWMQNLAGMKTEGSSLFKLAYKNDSSKEIMAMSEYLGIGMHLAILAISCFLTYKYIKKTS